MYVRVARKQSVNSITSRCCASAGPKSYGEVSRACSTVQCISETGEGVQYCPERGRGCAVLPMYRHMYKRRCRHMYKRMYRHKCRLM